MVDSRIMTDMREPAAEEPIEPEYESGFVASESTAVEVGPFGESAERSLNESGAGAAMEDDDGRGSCAIIMGYGDTGVKCGRGIHIAPEGVDEKPVCLMHSKDPQKHSGMLFAAFMEEFEKILEQAGEGEAHFEHFVFPQLNFAWRVFEAFCLFAEAIFTRRVNFHFATFTKEAGFFGATFEQDAHFLHTTFTRDAVFRGASFSEGADFERAFFVQGATFKQVRFKKNAGFRGSTFTQNTDFSKAAFMQDADFSEAAFGIYAYFREANFAQSADFSSAAFEQDSDFSGATFMQSANFRDTKFHGTVDLQGSRFMDRAEFRRTKFCPRIEGQPSAVFAFASFSKPNEIVFDDVDLSRALFLDRDISQVWFASSVHWGTRYSNRGLSLFEERSSLGRGFAARLQRDGERDFRAVAQIYQQLKKNYDSRLDYRTADEFHFGEMEMKRLAGPRAGPLLGLRQLLHRRLSMVAIYRYASDYGNSFWKPTCWLLVTLVLFAVLLPLPEVGLRRNGTRQTETYSSVWQARESIGSNLWIEVRLVGKGVITSIDTASFQKNAEYQPAYPWGRVLAIIENLITSSLFALFLLAIRRQFRR